jgi:hypothetical protein
MMAIQNLIISGTRLPSRPASSRASRLQDAVDMEIALESLRQSPLRYRIPPDHGAVIGGCGSFTDDTEDTARSDSADHDHDIRVQRATEPKPGLRGI